MRRFTVKQGVAALLAFVLLVSAMPLRANAPNLSQMQQEQRILQQNIRQAQNELRDTRREMGQAERELAELDERLMIAMENMLNILAALDETEYRLIQAEQELEDARNERDQQFELVQSRLRELHEVGEVSLLDVLIQSSSVRDFLVRMENLNRITQHDQQMLRRMDDAEARYALSVEDVHRQRNSVELLRIEHERYMQELERLDEKWEAIFSELSEEAAAIAQELRAQQTAEQQLEREIRAEQNRLHQLRLQAQRAAIANFTGPMVFPVPGMSRISSLFGYRIHPISRVRQMHWGVDMAAPSGTHIYAAADGIVITSQAGWNGGFGTMIVIDHGSGIHTLYAHNSRNLVRVGDEVQAGQLIGLVGSTGNSTGPHLHFEVRVNGARVNPQQFLGF